MPKISGSRCGQPFRLILPKQERLREAFDKVMEQAGLEFKKPSGRAAVGVTSDRAGILPDIETYELRSEAALDWVNNAAADLAIIGQDVLRENQAGAAGPSASQSILDMNRISKCSLWIAAKPEMYINDLTDLGDMRLATSYPDLLQQLLDKQGVRAGKIITQKGGVESLITAGRADAILEIVQTGNSLRENGLEKKLFVFNSCATLVRNTNNTGNAREALISHFAARLEEALSEDSQILVQPVTIPSARAETRPAFTRPVGPVPVLTNV